MARDAEARSVVGEFPVRAAYSGAFPLRIYERNGVIAQNNQRDEEDQRDASARALRLGGRPGQEIASSLLLVHVVEPIAVAPQWQPCIEEADEARVADARAQLQRLTKQLRFHVLPTRATSQMLSATLGQRRFYRDTPTRIDVVELVDSELRWQDGPRFGRLDRHRTVPSVGTASDRP